MINLYGSYYSILLRHFGLKGFASGICTKDSADPESFPTGGPPGGPEPRFYFPLFKVKLDRAESRVSLSMNPDIECTCGICGSQREQMLDPATPKAVSRQAMRQHFMTCRNDELESLNEKTLDEDLAELSSTLDRYGGSFNAPSTLPPIVQLARWSHALRT